MDRETFAGLLNALDQALEGEDPAQDAALIDALWPLFADEVRAFDASAENDEMGNALATKLIAFLESPRKTAFVVMLLKKAQNEFSTRKA